MSSPRGAIALLALALAACGAPQSRTPSAPAVQASAAPVPMAVASEASADPEQAASAPTERTAPRGWLGVALTKRAADEPGVLVRQVVRGSPGAAVGIAVGDAIVSVNGANVSRPEDVIALIGEHEPGERVSVGYLHGSATRLAAVTLGDFPSADRMLRMQYVNEVAPGFDALEVAQGSLSPSLAPLRGKVVLVEFWASWCPPCRLLSPVLETWHERYQAQGVTVLGIAAEPLGVVTSSGLELGIGYALFADPSGATSRAYSASSLPTLFVIDKRGQVRDLMVGYSSSELTRIEALVRVLVQES